MGNANSRRSAGGTSPMELCYRRAEALEHEMMVESMTLNSRIFPCWIGDTDRFWYVRRVRKADGLGGVTRSFRCVEAKTGDNRELFDHELLARLLAAAAKQPADPENLPLTNLVVADLPARGGFDAFGKRWRFEIEKGVCVEVDTLPCNWLVSPDAKKAAFVRDSNIWIRCLKTAEEQALTGDGKRYDAYGVRPQRENLCNAYEGSGDYGGKPEAVWSPDSTKLLTVQTDECEVGVLPLVSGPLGKTSLRPLGSKVKYALPGDDSIASYRFISLDVRSGLARRARHEAVPDSLVYSAPISGGGAWWSADSGLAYFLNVSSGQREVQVIEFDVGTGRTRLLFEERSDTYIDLALEFERPAYLKVLPETNELIWYSERSGWGHLYLYDLETGALKNAITKGDWLVREILHVDAMRRQVTIAIAGRDSSIDPYYREVWRADLDTGLLTKVACGDCDIGVPQPDPWAAYADTLGYGGLACSGISPDAEYAVVTRARADAASVTELLGRDGTVLNTVEEAELAGLPNGWHWPEPVKLFADDGVTEVYGVVCKPSSFSPERQYPVLDWAGTNPFYTRTPKSFGSMSYIFRAMAFAELGFVVVMIDGRGSSHRSKRFHDHSYGNVQKGSDLADHVCGIRQLAERRPYMDLDRVGIVDMEGSNAPLYGLLDYPDFYKVGALYSYWDPHFLRQGEVYEAIRRGTGPQSLPLLERVGNLQGKLLLGHGGLDPYFHVSGFFCLIDALVRANKDFDLCFLPSGGHGIGSSQCYGLRRIWDYFVRNLSSESPPESYCLKSAPEYALDHLRAQSSVS